MSTWMRLRLASLVRPSAVHSISGLGASESRLYQGQHSALRLRHPRIQKTATQQRNFWSGTWFTKQKEAVSPSTSVSEAANLEHIKETDKLFKSSKLSVKNPFVIVGTAIVVILITFPLYKKRQDNKLPEMVKMISNYGGLATERGLRDIRALVKKDAGRDFPTTRSRQIQELVRLEVIPHLFFLLNRKNAKLQENILEILILFAQHPVAREEITEQLEFLPRFRQQIENEPDMDRVKLLYQALVKTVVDQNVKQAQSRDNDFVLNSGEGFSVEKLDEKDGTQFAKA